MEISFKTLGYARKHLKNGGHINQRIKGDNYCQLIKDGVVGYISPAEYNLLKTDPLIEEKTLPEDRIQGYRKIRILVQAKDAA